MTEYCDNFCSQLKLSHPDHVLVKRAAAAEEAFDRAVQTIAWRLDQLIPCLLVLLGFRSILLDKGVPVL